MTSTATSRPPTPASHTPSDELGSRFCPHGTPCESGEEYDPGGYHPIDLGDVLNSRYEVVRKLGYGSHSTVWLAVDQPSNRYVALKVMIARIGEAKAKNELSLYQTMASAVKGSEESLPFLPLDDHFIQKGPNGHHQCLVFHPMGPHLSQFILDTPEFLRGDILDGVYILPTITAKRILRNVLQGLQLLHRAGIVHGDLHPGNVLLNIKTAELDTTTPSRIGQGPEEGDVLYRLDGKKDLWAPSYLLPPKPLHEFTSTDQSPLIKLADLGAAFLEDTSCQKVVTPAHLRSPECLLGFDLGSGVDVWSFGCLMYELLKMTFAKWTRTHALRAELLNTQYLSQIRLPFQQ